MTLKECLTAVRAEKLVALEEPVLAKSEAVEGVEEQNRPVKTADSAADSNDSPRKPDDCCGRSEIYPKSTCISPSTPIKLIQGDIIFADAQRGSRKSDSVTERVGHLGETRVDREGLKVDRAKGDSAIGENGVAATPAVSERPKKPYFTADGTLRIPFDCDPKYHWWKGGQSMKKTIAELRGEAVEELPSEDVSEKCG